MFGTIIFFSFLYWSYSVADNMIGPGVWKMRKIEKTPSDFEQFEFNIVQRKYNRTHDMFKGSLKFNEELNEFFNVKLDICKYVDGGCKQYLVITEDSFTTLIDKYAASNFEEILAMAGAQQTTFPVPPGEYKIDEYLWNWDGLPDECPYGDYAAHCCICKGSATMGCLSTELQCVEIEDDEE